MPIQVLHPYMFKPITDAVPILVLEDEAFSADRLLTLLAQVKSSLQVQAVLESVAEAVTWLRSYPMPQLIFMDIHLADGKALDILTQVQVDAPIIFTTSYDEYLLEAFRTHSVAYCLSR